MDADKQCCLVILIDAADGHKLPPLYAIFIYKKCAQRMVFTWDHSKYPRRGLDDRLNGFGLCAMFCSDNFRDHLTEQVRRSVKEGSDVVVIPGGMTKLLQPVDVVVNRSFKAVFRRLTWRHSKW
ncbi:hypothetical protein PR048_011340 [Dryococelus australis]|uniref:DDE-1 domain-containing protein n=1 Tax=Dryococelus australis TaxID=614101 RepID=A0ABQ9HLW2_9NEOP|nr:hypothetical protein PR048_011340 [Dryococelus australis]